MQARAKTFSDKLSYLTQNIVELTNREQSLLTQSVKESQRSSDLTKVLALFKDIAQLEEFRSRNVFISIINFGLNIVFGPDILFDLKQTDDKRGVFYKPIVIKRGKIEDLLDSSGGGLLDVISFLARIVVLVNFFKPDQRTIRLDEPFKFLDDSYSDKIPELLQSLSTEFQIQFIISSHKLELISAADKKFEVSLINRRTTIKQSANQATP